MAEEREEDGTVFELVAEDVSAANAHLIAAAPELYQAGKRALKALEIAVAAAGGEPTKHSACAQLRAALAKARGETQ